MASIWNLPVIYLCENNLYAMSTPFDQAFKIEEISQRAIAYGIKGLTVDGNDVFAVHKAVREAAERARKGDGPTLIEAITYRWRGHSKSDRQAYRTREEVKAWMEKDPIPRFAAKIGVDDKEMEKIKEQVKQDIQKAVEFAEASPEPDVSTILEGVYA
jgi:pyruvate dehydrogenase E1 component alpha subunit